MLKNLKSKITKIGFKKFVVCSVVAILAISLAACTISTDSQKDIDNSDNVTVEDISSNVNHETEIAESTDSTTSEDDVNFESVDGSNNSNTISGDPNSNVASSSVNSSNTTSTNSVSSTTSSTSSTNSNSSESSSVSSVPVTNTSSVTSNTSSSNNSTSSTSSEVTNESDVTASFPTDAIVIESGEAYPTIKLEVLTTYYGYVGYFTMSQSLKEAKELIEEIVPGSCNYKIGVCATEYVDVETNKTVRFVLQNENMEGKDLLYDYVYPAGAGKTKVNVVY